MHRARRFPTQTLAQLATACLLLLLFAVPVRAATQVNGTIAGQTWTTAGSPYQVTGDLLVASLAIQPGVEVQVLGNYVIEVAGVLSAVGKSTAMIRFRPSNAAVGWQGIYFNESPAGSVLEYCRVEGSKNSGVRLKNSLPQFRNCSIAGNSAPVAGGGLNAVLAAGRLSLSSCELTNNTASIGGGIYAEANGSSLLVLSSCLVSKNTANGGTYKYGAGMAFYGTLAMSNTVVSMNTSAMEAGGVYAGKDARMFAINCLMISNVATLGGAGFGGKGGDTVLALRNCTVTKNQPEAFYVGSGAWVAMTNCIVYANGSGSWVTDESPSSGQSVAYSNTQGGTPYPGTGNISANPVLDPVTYMLLPGSPCIDAGHPATAFNDGCRPPSLGGVRNDMGAFGGPGACLGVGTGSDDSDQDGLLDEWEIRYFGGIASQNAAGEPDEDNLTNAEEFELGTDPTKPDTDSDGYRDDAELRTGSDPLDPTSVPPPSLVITVQQVRIEFPAAVGERNRVESSADMLSWRTVEEITGTGAMVRRIYNVEDDYRFFRLIRP